MESKRENESNKLENTGDRIMGILGVTSRLESHAREIGRAESKKKKQMVRKAVGDKKRRNRWERDSTKCEVGCLIPSQGAGAVDRLDVDGGIIWAQGT